ncbi:MAG: ATP-dependent endonuclease [Mesorhizobium sp.]|nr:MAG: ATP-dependent endonuclease [Mesorhizobium sp.]
MHIQALRIWNFRRLKNARIDLEKDISIFVGANNSGKTSAGHAIGLFLGDDTDGLTVHDFSVDTWAQMDAFGAEQPDAEMPTISMDVWLTVGQNDLYRVLQLLPSVNWQGSVVGVRIEYAANDPAGLLERFKGRRKAALEAVQLGQAAGQAAFDPSPRNMHEFLSTNIKREFGLRYFVLDRSQFDDNFEPIGEVAPQPFEREQGRQGKDVLASLIKVDMLYAQRHLSDTAGGARAEDLTKRISRIYATGASERGNHPEALLALMDAERAFNKHLKDIFDPFLEQVGQMGYPGVANPRLLIKSSLNPTAVLQAADGAQVHYAITDAAGDAQVTLPDRYNGLGYKNLIYMVIELFDLHSKWLKIEDKRPLLHLVFIEEPEAHLHMQLQQVFIRKILEIVTVEGEDAEFATSQVVVTTHSSHIVYERGFIPVRYFRRSGDGVGQQSEVLNLSLYYQQLEPPLDEFLVRYMKLTHCDLFFADAAVLVEGNVERLLLPEMIAIAAPRLKSTYLSVLEVGGAYAHIFRRLIEFIGITALVITDIDSVFGPAENAEAGADPADEAVVEPGDDDEDEAAGPKPGQACVVATPGAVTSNQTLIEWLPAKRNIADLLEATSEQRTQNDANVRIVYQSSVDLTSNGETKAVVGRTLEEAFALENFAWCQPLERKAMNLRFKAHAGLTVDQIVERVHKRVTSSNFKKTSFALGLLQQEQDAWTVPRYIREGLEWLEGVAAPLPPEPAPDPVLVVQFGADVEVVGDGTPAAPEESKAN